MLAASTGVRLTGLGTHLGLFFVSSSVRVFQTFRFCLDRGVSV